MAVAERHSGTVAVAERHSGTVAVAERHSGTLAKKHSGSEAQHSDKRTTINDSMARAGV